ncbi:SDR family oxidoreductase [Longirhabdus pacifica]|uniref:SDR family oxidoreductase n=1 Tax=Longirhabdus pacifica TaxID=2305227 RepID=UPI0013E8B900|nr:SDR family oxidoreductase [Longirhabdus pacifica]
MDHTKLQHKNVLITGAAGGLGTELCFAFGSKGASIIAVDISLEKLESLQSQLKDNNIDCGVFLMDITDKSKCQETMAEIEKKYDSIDIVIHNAGISHRSPFIDTKLDVLHNVLDVNVIGAINLTHYTLPSVIKSKGTFIALSSVAGFAPLYGRTAYSASKHALHGFFETLRSEVEEYGVHVMLVYPSFIKTAIVQNALSGDGKKPLNQIKTVGNVLTPDYVAACIVKGALKNKKRMYISPISKSSLWLSRFAPNMYSKIMKKKVMAEFANK